jgi:hypothetical protein
MASESKETKVKVGTKLTDAEVKALNPKDVGNLYAQPKKAGVEGQYYIGTYQICPYCGCIGNVGLRSPLPSYFVCHCCGGVFRP